MSAVFVLQRPEAGEELESSPGGPSLQRYMEHFTILDPPFTSDVLH